MAERRRRISDIIPCVDDKDDGSRASRRFALNADVTFLQPANTTGVALDANNTGMRVVVDHPIAVGARCIAVVQLAQGGETHERAEVVWMERSATGWVIGLHFVA